MTEKLLYTVEEAAGLLGVSERTMRRLVGNGDVSSVLIGDLRRITPRALREFVDLLDEQSRWGSVSGHLTGHPTGNQGPLRAVKGQRGGA